MRTKDTGFVKPMVFATLTLLVSMGIRNTIGLFVSPIVANTVMTLSDVSLALAIGQFCFGFFQPFCGILTTKLRLFTILLSGAFCLILGFLGIKFANSILVLILCYGILTPAGAAASSFPILMGHISKAVPADKQSIASGVINAGGSAGQFILTPLIQLCINKYGYYGAGVFLACAVALSIVPAWFLSRPVTVHQTANANAAESSAAIADGGFAIADGGFAIADGGFAIADGGLKREMAAAFKTPGYLFLHFGFFACGFHIAFLATHLPGEIGFYKYGGSVVALCFSLLALCNIAGCVAVGIVGRYIKHKTVLAVLYGTRALLIALYLPAPKTAATFVVFSLIAGLTFSATVPPTGNIAAALVHPKHYSTLFGLIFLTHQIGSFFGAWLGGLVMDNTGSFFLMWVFDAGLSVLAALCSWRIERGII